MIPDPPPLDQVCQDEAATSDDGLQNSIQHAHAQVLDDLEELERSSCLLATLPSKCFGEVVNTAVTLKKSETTIIQDELSEQLEVQQTWNCRE